jgi:hypothetical protein
MRKSSNSLALSARAVVLLLALAGSPLASLAQTRGPAKQTRAAAPQPQATASDIKVRSRVTVGEQTFESVEYVRGSRQRTEMSMAGGYKTIMQCDLKRYVQINDQTRTYMVQPFGGGEAREEAQTAAAEDPAAQGAARRGGVVTVVNTLTDTGERKEMFGYTARRLKGSTEYQSSPDACQKGGRRMETDGWYIDLKYGVDCPAAYKGGEQAMSRRQGCHDEIRSKQVGTAKAGYPVLVTTKMYNEDGTFNTTTREVLELSRSPLDPSLFEVPEGYTESNPYAQAAAAAASGRAGADDEVSGSNSQANSSDGARPSSPSAAKGALGPKRPGVVRIGVVLPRTQMTQGASGMDVATAVRNTLAQHLSSEAVEVAPLEAHDPQQAEAEARRKECDYLLYTGVVQKKGGGGGFGGFLKKAAPVVAGGYGGGEGGTAANASPNGVHTAADVSTAVKAKDEITLDFRLMPAAGGSTPKVADTLKAKARHDGEDVLTPLIERLAAAVSGGV